jgi:hypothetical protein
MLVFLFSAWACKAVGRSPLPFTCHCVSP